MLELCFSQSPRSCPVGISDTYCTRTRPDCTRSICPSGRLTCFTRNSRGRAQVALLVDVDPVGLVRGRAHGGGEGSLDQYVNDRPYAASSLLSVGISRVFGTALSGRSKERQELAEQALHLEATITALPCRAGESFLRSLFEPLAYTVEAEHHPLDERFPDRTRRLPQRCRGGGRPPPC